MILRPFLDHRRIYSSLQLRNNGFPTSFESRMQLFTAFESIATMPEPTNRRRSQTLMGKLVLGLTVVALLVTYHMFPSNTQHHYKSSPSPSTINSMPKSMADQHDAVILDPEHAPNTMVKLFVDRLHPRQLVPTTKVRSIAERVYEERGREARHMISSDGKCSTTCSLICARGKGNCNIRGSADDGADYDELHHKRFPLKWTEHRGPPKKHSPPERVTKAKPMARTLQRNRKVAPIKAVGASYDTFKRASANDPHTEMSVGNTIPEPSASQVPNNETIESQNGDSKILQQTADKNPHTSQNLGIDRPKPSAISHTSDEKVAESYHASTDPPLEKRKLRCLCGPDICNTDPDRCKIWRWWPRRSTMESHVTTVLGAKDIRQFGDKKALLAHSQSTYNENLPERRETVSVTSNKERFEAHHSGLVPRKVVCDCGPYICGKYRSLCKRWRQVPDRKRSVLNTPVKILDEQPQPTFLTPVSSTKGSTSGDKHYIPAYWRNSGHADETTALQPTKLAEAEKVPHQNQHNQGNRNRTYSKPTRAPGVAIGDVFVPKKCNGMMKGQLNQCESTNQASIIFYSLLGIFVTSILLLALLKCYMCVRRRRNVAAARNTKTRPYDKSGTSTHPSFAADSLSSKREMQGDNASPSRAYMNLDGADDSWPNRKYCRTWNIFSRSRRVPGRYSPIPQARAPRIPTLKLPKPVFATVRKVSGLGFEGMLVSYKKGFKGNVTDISRVKWTSTV
ncbi:hypothetical protein BKA65DRAFT_52854 [Rhexocercosporidium sp. MPI-PUGE-AT-0058]|nr:hypothetical protein BKA65DRAFT_52854 [Rhexocercosporidium sp. MPI-PUGE-AT-0058]